MEYPQTNEQVESANKVILNELKKRLSVAKGRWPKELLEVFWAYRCIPQSLTQETPYSLTYGTDIMIPVEVGVPLYVGNSQIYFHQGDLVWRMRSNARKDEGKFSSNWEGPFCVQSSVGKGVYRLETLTDTSIPQTWNATHLKFYFS